jgi:hypothetical protein
MDIDLVALYSRLMRSFLGVCSLVVALASAAHCSAELRIPACTGYAEPDPESVEMSPDQGVTGWTDPKTRLLWFGDFSRTGSVSVAVSLRVVPGEKSRLRFTVLGNSRELLVATARTNRLTIAAGAFQITKPGYHSLTLESLNPPGKPIPEIEAITLDGPASADAHFNLKPRRNAASVHLSYPPTGLTNIDAFYCEVTAQADPVWTFYMACGWHRGYFGMQVNSASERRIIFSVWDSGHEAVDRAKVGSDDRVQLVSKGDGVDAGDFGNEGTGGHSHWVFPWRTGEQQRFLITAKPADSTHTVFSGYYFEPDKKQWRLISSWKAPKDGGYLRGLHSFSENFGGANGHLRRKALYGNQWVRTSHGDWHELTTASFSHDPTGKTDRLDRFMGVEDGRFYLSHGGFVPGTTSYGEKFERPSSGKPPSDLPAF